jgi:hypothetical protein
MTMTKFYILLWICVFLERNFFLLESIIKKEIIGSHVKLFYVLLLQYYHIFLISQDYYRIVAI